MKVKTIVLAAGQGTRMHSAYPKVMHKIADQPLLVHVYNMAREIPKNDITIIYGHGGDYVLEQLQHLNVNWREQKQQLGTGHAVMQVTDLISEEDIVLILYGDVPLLKYQTVRQLLDIVDNQTLALLTVNLDNPSGYGRIIRSSDQQVLKIVEEKDASISEKQVTEVNTGIMAAQGSYLKRWLGQLDNNNAQNEYYLTDIIEIAVADGVVIRTSQPASEDEVLGVNNRMQLSHLERTLQRERAIDLMEKGVTLVDPARFDLRGEIISLGQDIEIDINVILEGRISLGNNVKIGANTIIRDVVIADDVEILPNSLIEQSTIGQSCNIGPYARIRPGTKLEQEVRIGNFVEVKKSQIAAGSKVNHLSYIGDTIIGKKVNVGAGTITCNYDGINKSQTVIKDGAFIGSDTQLVAPVTVGEYATVGAGSTITRDVPDNQLALSRVKQLSITGWQRPKKKEA
ncbi:MAG: bifunctional UDP-N-acetylglucosamine diphosphorylase/glucosamine-1-phosphate N-acetyltransferase GlmU [Methylococcaceae bacterium]